MRGLNHPYIIEYRGYFTDNDFEAKSDILERPDSDYGETERANSKISNRR
jgi:hypothetical protein